jgi:phosphatidylserine/phosphatidylglycerophosphate/cardiolipin synthase-like enzyme
VFSEPSEAAPFLTYIGSSNLGERSWRRDFELGFVVASREEGVRRAMAADLGNLVRYCRKEQTQAQTQGQQSHQHAPKRPFAEHVAAARAGLQRFVIRRAVKGLKAYL